MPIIKLNYTDAGRSTSKRPKQNNDCTVVCFAVLFNLPYDEAFDILNKQGRQNNKGFHFDKLERVFPSLLAPEPYLSKTFITVTDAVNYSEQHNLDLAVIIYGHIFAVTKGIVHDHSLKPSATVCKAYRKIGELDGFDKLFA